MKRTPPSSPLFRRARHVLLTSALLALALVACSPSRVSNPAPSSPVTPSPTASNLRDQTLTQLNVARSQARSCGSRSFAAARPLNWNAKLEAAAHAHNRDMIAKNFFDHTGSDGSTLRTRVERVGYAWTAIGENLAAGQDTLEAAMRGWLGSPGHCANIMNPSFAEVGLSALKGGSNNTFDWYWTMDFGRP